MQRKAIIKRQVAKALLDDFEQTIDSLSNVAASLKDCENPKLKQFGYKRINFRAHRYFMLYRMIENIVVADDIFRELRDYENHLL